jgi:hypothetical protein
MTDIAPELLEQIRATFLKNLGDATVTDQTYQGATDYALQVGQALSDAFRQHLSGDILPDGKMYWNIAERVIRPLLEEDHSLVSVATRSVQQALNEAAGIGLRAQAATLDSDRVDGLLQRLCAAEQYDDIAWLLDEPVKTFSLSVVDDTLQSNMEFQGKAGLSPKIVRRSESKCCKWCSSLAGTYTYPNVPKDVYRRHENCRCTVEYVPAGVKRQNVHTKQWTESEKKSKIQKKTKYAPSPQRSTKGIQVKPKKYAQLTGIMNTRYPGLKKEDGSRLIYDSSYCYCVQADNYGGLIIMQRFKLK